MSEALTLSLRWFRSYDERKAPCSNVDPHRMPIPDPDRPAIRRLFLSVVHRIHDLGSDRLEVALAKHLKTLADIGVTL